LPGGIAVLPIAGPPNENQIWDPATHSFVARPILRDKVERTRFEPYYEDWLRWKNTMAEAQARGLAADVIAALTAKFNAEWTQYVNAISDWRNAK
jgi:hypothetical protein